MENDDKIEKVNRTKRDFHDLIDNLGDIPPEAIPLMEDAFVKMSREGLSLPEALGFTPEIMEVIYQHAYHLFQSGKYGEALLVFNLLRQLNPDDNRFTFAIAACHHYNKDYVNAAAHYLVYETRDIQNPIPYFHLYDCFTKLGHSAIALNALNEALRLAKLNPKHDKLKEKIQLELNYLEASSTRESQK